MMELYKTPLQFFRRYQPELVNKEQPYKYIVKGGISYFEDMLITIKQRAPVV